ncbi:hypothetical protein AZE42_02067 [Rhizopogon vesiculosus]|uniref:Uncharacterized protein n=1 Tax=Rhizopogon vesiculosus TaxID=180088 RepID=A0A1J8Q4Q1_9AGAM|nr:hypothetical protein AZE42_02067 [Rhizopogon vesiculosus]
MSSATPQRQPEDGHTFARVVQFMINKAASGSIKELDGLCNIAQHWNPEQLVILLPVFYHHLDPARIPDVVNSRDVRAIMLARYSLKGVLVTLDCVCSPDKLTHAEQTISNHLLSNWHRCHPWINFFYRHFFASRSPARLPGLLVTRSEALKLVVNMLMRMGLIGDSKTPQSLVNTPSLHPIISQLWCMAITSKDNDFLVEADKVMGSQERGAFQEHMSYVVQTCLDVGRPLFTNTLIDVAGGIRTMASIAFSQQNSSLREAYIERNLVALVTYTLRDLCQLSLSLKHDDFAKHVKKAFEEALGYIGLLVLKGPVDDVVAVVCQALQARLLPTVLEAHAYIPGTDAEERMNALLISVFRSYLAFDKVLRIAGRELEAEEESLDAVAQCNTDLLHSWNLFKKTVHRYLDLRSQIPAASIYFDQFISQLWVTARAEHPEFQDCLVLEIDHVPEKPTDKFKFSPVSNYLHIFPEASERPWQVASEWRQSVGLHGPGLPPVVRMHEGDEIMEKPNLLFSPSTALRMAFTGHGLDARINDNASSIYHTGSSTQSS